MLSVVGHLALVIGECVRDRVSLTVFYQWYRSTGTGGVGTYLSIRIATTRQHCLHTRYSILHTKSCQYCAVQHNRTIMPLLFSCSLFQSVKRMNIQIIVVVTVLCRLHVMLWCVQLYPHTGNIHDEGVVSIVRYYWHTETVETSTSNSCRYKRNPRPVRLCSIARRQRWTTGCMEWNICCSSHQIGRKDAH